MALRSVLVGAVTLGAAAAHAALPSMPTRQWQWTADPHGTPVVVQLTDDDGNGRVDGADSPDVAFLSGDRHAATLNAVHGDTGAAIFSISAPRMSADLLAAGDVDGDGTIELVTGNETEVHVLERDGSLQWTRPWPGDFSFHQEGSILLVDLDQDGGVEIVGAATEQVVVVSVLGTLSWIGGSLLSFGFSPCQAVDLASGSSGTEILCGGVLTDARGATVWNVGVPSGATAIGDVDGDGEPDIALVTNEADALGFQRRLRLLDRTGAVVGPVIEMGEGTRAGASEPLVADLDGDGLSEVVVPAQELLRAFEWDGTRLAAMWTTPITDASGTSSATAFDFDGDSAFEVVYQDELSWRILDGADGSVLFEQPAGSITLWEIPVVANIDADAAAEILVLSESGSEGLVAWQVAGSAPSRRIWNQRTYHACNVSEDGTIPTVEAPAWRAHRSWHAQIGIKDCEELVSGCWARIDEPLPDRVACAGEPVVLDSSGVDVSGCADALLVAWLQDGAPAGTDPTLTVAPVADTTIELTVTCSTDPACAATDTVVLTTRARPAFDTARAFDPSACGFGIDLTWSAAAFPAGGVYNLYRSDDPANATCADALARAPLVLGLATTGFVDTTAVPGLPYAYVVEAEDGRGATSCDPRGALAGGASTRICLEPPVIDAGEVRPEGIGAVLRVSHVGHEVALRWDGARGLLPREHFHVMKSAGDPRSLSDHVNPEGDLARVHVETDTSSPLQFFEVRVAAACEELSPDDEPAGQDGPCPVIGRGSFDPDCLVAPERFVVIRDAADHASRIACGPFGAPPPAPLPGQELILVTGEGIGCATCVGVACVRQESASIRRVTVERGDTGGCGALNRAGAWALVAADPAPFVVSDVGSDCSPHPQAECVVAVSGPLDTSCLAWDNRDWIIRTAVEHAELSACGPIVAPPPMPGPGEMLVMSTRVISCTGCVLHRCAWNLSERWMRVQVDSASWGDCDSISHEGTWTLVPDTGQWVDFAQGVPSCP